MNILQALRESTNFIKQVTNQSQIESKIEAEHIFMFILQVSKTKLYEQYDSILTCLLYTSPSPRDLSTSRMPSSA